LSTFKKPIAGEPANLILGESFQSALVDVVNAYQRGELTRKETGLRKDHVVMVQNVSGTDVKSGEMLSLTDSIQPPTYDDTVQSFMQNPLTEGDAVTWHGNIGQVAVAVQPILDGMIGPCAYRPWGQVQADIGGAGDWLMISPDDPKQFKRATGGIARVINPDFTTGKCVADFLQQQPLWRFELTEDVSNLIGIGDLIDLGGNVYASNTSIRFTNSTKVAGDAGFCLHTGNYFDAIEAAATIGGEPTPRFKFRLKTDFDDTGVATAYVLDVSGNVTNPDGSPVELNDILTVHDPRKCFAHAVGADSLAAIHLQADPFFPAGGSVGYAVKTNQLKASTSDPDDPQYPRWEVEQCTQTVQRMKVQILGAASLPGGNSTQPTGQLLETDKTLFFDPESAILSRWPDVDYAPEWQPSGSEVYPWQIECKNPHRFSAGDGWAIIERVVNRSRVEDAENVDTPYTANTQGTVEWHVVDVQNPVARWIRCSYGASQGWSYDSPAEGENPSAVNYRFDDGQALNAHILTAPGLQVDCLDDGEFGWAFFDPNAQRYYIIATQSSLYGTATDIQPVATALNVANPMAEFSECDLTLRKLVGVKVFGGKDACEFTQQEVTVAASLTAVDVVAEVTRVGDEFCFRYDTVYVCRTDTGVSDDCLNVCCDEILGCCEYPPGTYTPNVTEAYCQTQGGVWTAGDCPETDCYHCSLCEITDCDGTIISPALFETGSSPDPNFETATFAVTTEAMTGECELTMQGIWTNASGATVSGVLVLRLEIGTGGYPVLTLSASPATVWGFEVDGWELLPSGSGPDPCDEGYGIFLGAGVQPTNGQTETWAECSASTTCCTIEETP